MTKEHDPAPATGTNLGEVLRQVRERQGLSQRAAAFETGIQPSTVNRAERGEGSLRLATLQAYLAGLGCTLEMTIRERRTGEVIGSAFLPSSDEPPA